MPITIHRQHRLQISVNIFHCRAFFARGRPMVPNVLLFQVCSASIFGKPFNSSPIPTVPCVSRRSLAFPASNACISFPSLSAMTLLSDAHSHAAPHPPSATPSTPSQTPPPSTAHAPPHLSTPPVPSRTIPRHSTSNSVNKPSSVVSKFSIPNTSLIFAAKSSHARTARTRCFGTRSPRTSRSAQTEIPRKTSPRPAPRSSVPATTPPPHQSPAPR